MINDIRGKLKRSIEFGNGRIGIGYGDINVGTLSGVQYLSVWKSTESLDIVISLPVVKD